jgi:low temperature requirement protein LtrA
MPVAIPDAFGERGLIFALAYVAIQVGRTVFVLISLGGSQPLSRNFQRVLPWSHMVAIAVLAVLVGFHIPTLALSGAAGLIVVGLAVWDTLANGGGVRSPRRSAT